VLYEPVYNTLRTKQQLGYTVHSYARLNYGVLGFTVVVVTPKYQADTVEKRVEGFLEGFGGELEVGLRGRGRGRG
jgi:secreted Zn-dependent insulinase-like peptidase